MQEWGCAALASLAGILASHPGKGSGALQAVCAAMEAFPQESAVQERGCTVIAQLGTHPELVEGQGPAVWDLPVKAMQAHPYSARVQASACKALHGLVLSDGARRRHTVCTTDAQPLFCRFDFGRRSSRFSLHTLSCTTQTQLVG